MAWERAWTGLLLRNFWGSWRTKTSRETRPRARRIKLVSSSCDSCDTPVLSIWLPDVRPHVGKANSPFPPCLLHPDSWLEVPPFLWHLKSESCLIHHSPFCFWGLTPMLMLVWSFLFSFPGAWLLAVAWFWTPSSFGHLELEALFFLNVYLASSSLLALILILLLLLRIILTPGFQNEDAPILACSPLKTGFHPQSNPSPYQPSIQTLIWTWISQSQYPFNVHNL